MQWTIVGLGNPDEEYAGTRHNVGRDLLVEIAKKEGVNAGLAEWKKEKLLKALVAKGTLFGKKVTLVLPDAYMNNSGASLRPLVASEKDAAKLVVIHDELDLPLGRVKLSVGSGAGGHRGIDSIHKILKTKEFVRIRVGIAPSTPAGKTKKPPQEKVVDHVLGKFRAPELEKLKAVRKVVSEALELILTSTVEKATMVIHSK